MNMDLLFMYVYEHTFQDLLCDVKPMASRIIQRVHLRLVFGVESNAGLFERWGECAFLNTEGLRFQNQGFRNFMIS